MAETTPPIPELKALRDLVELWGAPEDYDLPPGRITKIRAKLDALKLIRESSTPAAPETDPDMRPIVDYGDLMTIQDFVHGVELGHFIDYDGHGYYSDGKQMSSIRVTPSDLKRDGAIVGWTHVVWFNR